MAEESVESTRVTVYGVQEIQDETGSCLEWLPLTRDFENVYYAEELPEGVFRVAEQSKANVRCERFPMTHS